MNGPKWVQEALRLTEQAGRWEDADRGWKAHLSTEERLAFRRADLQEALVYATLAQAAANAELLIKVSSSNGAIPNPADDGWIKALGFHS